MTDSVCHSDPITFNEARDGAAAYLQSRLATKHQPTDSDFQIPVIDLTKSFSTSLVDRQAVATKIRDACTTSGFFYITNHHIPKTACDGILHEAERFMHELPLAKKEDLHLKNNKFGLGWEPSEYTSIGAAVMGSTETWMGVLGKLICGRRRRICRGFMVGLRNTTVL
jgi:isopenicillin N synthase-like dioxygenase